MAYVEMTVDGQTRETDVLKLVGSDGTEKVATLEAVLTEDDIPSAGEASFAKGSFVGNDTYTTTINTGLSEIHGILVYSTASFSTSVKTLNLALIDFEKGITTNPATGYDALTIGSNANMTTAYSTPMLNNTSRMRASRDGGNITLTSGNENGGGNFHSGATYRWIAW